MLYKKIFKNILFPVLEKFNGSSIGTKLKFLEESQWWSNQRLQEHQNRRLTELMEHAYTNVPYYTKLFDRMKLKPKDIKNQQELSKLPILSKEDIKKNPDDFRARNYINSSFPTFSSGSTGKPMRFYQTEEARSWCWAATFRAWEWSGFQLGDRYIKISLNKRDSFKKKLQDFLFNTKYIYSFDLTEDRIKQFIEHYEKFKPVIVRGYSSSMYIIANYIKKNHIKLKHKINAIYTTGENCFPEYRSIIEKQFSCKVIDGYGGGGELLSVAFQCERKKYYHLMDELVITELIDSEVPGSKKIILTGLFNYAMPLIRYDIGDLALETKGRCNCGRHSKIIKSINGRDTDIIRTKNGNFLCAPFFAAMFEHIEGVDEFQIIQDKITGIRINIIKNQRYTLDDEEKIVKTLRKAAGSDFQIRMRYVSKINLSDSGKRRNIISKLK